MRKCILASINHIFYVATILCVQFTTITKQFCATKSIQEDDIINWSTTKTINKRLAKYATYTLVISPQNNHQRVKVKNVCSSLWM